MTPQEQALWANEITRQCLLEAGNDVDAALSAAEYIVAQGPTPKDVALTTDAHGREHKGKGKGGGQFVSKDRGIDREHPPLKETHFVERYGSGGRRGLDKAGVFFARRGGGAEEYGDGNKPLYASVVPGTKLYQGTSSIEFAQEHGLMDEELPESVQEFTGCKTLSEVESKSIEGDIDTDTFYDAFQTVARLVLEEHGYQGVLWSGEEDLVPEQYQVWDRSAIRVSVADKKRNEGRNLFLSIDAYLSHDIKNPKAQGILNSAVSDARSFTNAARKDLEAALDKMDEDHGAAILAFVTKYHAKLADLLTDAQMSAVLEGMTEVADKVPQLNADAAASASLFGPAPQPTFSVDSSGHQHKGKGPGGGQFVSSGGSSKGDDSLRSGSSGERYNARLEPIRQMMDDVFDLADMLDFSAEEVEKIHERMKGADERYKDSPKAGTTIMTMADLSTELQQLTETIDLHLKSGTQQMSMLVRTKIQTHLRNSFSRVRRSDPGGFYAYQLNDLLEKVSEWMDEQP